MHNFKGFSNLYLIIRSEDDSLVPMSVDIFGMKNRLQNGHDNKKGRRAGIFGVSFPLSSDPRLLLIFVVFLSVAVFMFEQHTFVAEEGGLSVLTAVEEVYLFR